MYTNFDITFRKMSSWHIGDMLSLKEESWFGTHRVSILNDTDQKRWFEKVSQDPNSLILIAYNKEFKSIGTFKILNIDWMNRVADVGLDIFAYQRKKGYGKPLVKAGIAFCFDILNLRRLDAEILENNIASQKCADSAGFIKEGCRKEAVERCGKKIDSWTYGILKNENANSSVVL